MDYVSTFYDNFDALLEGDHQTATLLLKELDLDESDIGTKPWMDDVLIVYPDVEVASDGIATIYMNSNVWFDGDNPSLPRDTIVAEIKQRIDNRHGGNLAAIADALIAVFVDVYID